MIKYNNDCPNEDYRNVYYARDKNRNAHMFTIFDTFNSAKAQLKKLRLKQWAEIIEFDMNPQKVWVPTEHFYNPPKGLFYPEREKE